MIKINIDIPENCYKCPMSQEAYEDDEFFFRGEVYCCLNRKRIIEDIGSEQRSNFCQLIEVI